MGTVFRYTFSKMRWQILGWGISLGALAAYVLAFYATFSDQQEQFAELFQTMPPELFAFFGDINDMFTPAGFLQIEVFSYMPIILGIFVLMYGSGLLAGDEESGILDLVLAHPISRTALFFGRLLAFITALLLILLIIWGAIVATELSTEAMGLTPLELAYPFLSLMAVLFLFGFLSLLFSQTLPSRRMAALTVGLVLVASFFLTSLSSLDEDLEPIARLLPLDYYQGGNAIVEMNWEWFAGLMAVGLAFLLLSWWLFRRRDIRVGGEGGWRLPVLPRRRAQASLEG